jgi:fatty-acyl-CoA synthase
MPRHPDPMPAAVPVDAPPRRPGSSLLIRELLNRVRSWAPQETITYRQHRTLTYVEWLERVDRLGGWLKSVGVQPGERIGVLDWDSHRYLDLYFAVPMHGAALHTVNVRLTPEQIAWTIRHARDVVLFVHRDFLPLVLAVRSQLPDVRRVVLLRDDDDPLELPAGVDADYEPSLAAAAPRRAWPDFAEDTPATVFYTTGTTGEPKGVYFSHRQIVLHSLTAGLDLAIHDDPFALRGSDVYLPLTPMFHVHAWGLPYLATMLGMRQVYPGKYEPALLLALLERHRATFSHCVPTILQMLLHHPAAGTVDWSRLKLVIGGAALTPSLAAEARSRGIRIMGGYGMSETCPIIAVAHVKPTDAGLDDASKLGLVTRTGFPLPLVQAMVVDPEGRTLPPGRDHIGELVLRCPWLTHGYLDNAEASDALWRDGWLHTGDIAFRDPDGYLRITDRLKDVIKIGGEWISSLEIESALARHPAVKEVAVVAVPDAKWGEYPHAEVVLRSDTAGAVTARDLQKHLRNEIDAGTLHQRAILTRVAWAEALPRTSVGKIDKKALRARSAASGTPE